MAASNVKYLACLFSLLLFPGICLSGAVNDAPAAEYEEVVRDSAVLFRFVPGRLMFYYHYKDNENAIPKADSIIRANMDAIISGDAFIRIKGFCTSWPTFAQNRAAVKNRSNQVKSYYITHTGMKEEYYRTVNSTEPDTVFTDLGGGFSSPAVC